MNRPASSKFVPALPDDDDIDTPTNENASSKPDSIKIYDGVADCTMNDADTLKSVKSRAKDLAIQKVHQKIADYVYGFWKDRYLTLPDDEVLSIANEICTITDVKYKVFDSDDNTLVRATVLAQVDDNVLMNYIIQFFKERKELKIQNEALRKENSNLERQVEELKRQKDSVAREKSALDNQNETLRKENSNLKRQIEDLRSQNISLARENSTLSSQNRELNRQRTNNQQNTSQVISNFRIVLAEQNADKAHELFVKNRYGEAISYYDEAIRLNPNDDMSYNNRGLAYKNLRQYERALQDFNRAIQINPNNASAKYNRSQIHG